MGGINLWGFTREKPKTLNPNPATARACVCGRRWGPTASPQLLPLSARARPHPRRAGGDGQWIQKLSTGVASFQQPVSKTQRLVNAPTFRPKPSAPLSSTVPSSFRRDERVCVFWGEGGGGGKTVQLRQVRVRGRGPGVEGGARTWPPAALNSPDIKSASHQVCLPSAAAQPLPCLPPSLPTPSRRAPPHGLLLAVG